MADDGGSDNKATEAAVQARIDAAAASARRAAETRATELETQLRTTKESHTREIEGWQSKEKAWSEERTVMGAGITDRDGVDFARLAWGRVPADQRPSGGLAEWLGKRDALPKAVQAYLPTVQDASGSGGGASPAAHVVHPPANKGTTNGTPGGQPKMSVDQINAMSDEDFLKAAPDLLAGRR